MKRTLKDGIRYKSHKVTSEDVEVTGADDVVKKYPLKDLLYFSGGEIGVKAGGKVEITMLSEAEGVQWVNPKVKDRKYIAIVNPNSGTGQSKAAWEAVQDILEKNGVEGLEVHYTEGPLHAVEIAEKIMERDDTEKTVLVAAGGDGILHEIVNGLHLYEKKNGGKKFPTLSILPTGTGNGLAATLGIKNLPDAVKVVLDGVGTGLDGLLFSQKNPTDKKTGEVLPDAPKERVGFLHVTYGIIADIDFDSEWLRMLGAARFPITAVGKILMLPKYKAKLQLEVVTPTGGTDTLTLEDDFLSIQLSNVSEISANMVTNPAAVISDGLIDVGVIHWPKVTRYNAYQLFDLVESNPQSLLSVPWLTFYKAKKATLTPLTTKPSSGKIDFDGEWMPYGEITLTPLPTYFTVLS